MMEMRQTPIPPAPPTGSLAVKILVGVVIAIVALFVLGVGAFAILPGIAQAVEPRCSVGVYGYDVNLTMKGWRANEACDAFIKGFDQGANGSTTAYRTEPSDGTIICEYNVKGIDVVVRDKGVLKFTGNLACEAIRQKVTELNQ